MKTKKIFYIILICIFFIICILILFNNSHSTTMLYKFENSKLYIKIGEKDWSEVPYDFSLVIDDLNQNNNGKFYEKTYQLDNNKIVFYYIQKIKSIDNNSHISESLSNAINSYKYITYIVYSDDMAKTWTSVDIGKSNSIENLITSIYFNNKKNGTMVLKNSNSEYTYITKNGGKDWNIITK